MPRTEPCDESITKRKAVDMLLRTVTSEMHFFFDNKMHVQHYGVVMDAPLAPVVADIFMAHMETTLMERLMKSGVCE
jgi:hypothetical protein